MSEPSYQDLQAVISTLRQQVAELEAALDKYGDGVDRLQALKDMIVRSMSQNDLLNGYPKGEQ